MDRLETSLRQHGREIATGSPIQRSASRILPLSSEAISKIHSSKHITTISGVVLSLLENSLDGKSSKVDVVVDFTRGGCVVDDNGIGIPPAEFGNDGGLARMYFTSKRTTHDSLPAPGMHGSNGLFLAQLSALSLLIITSKQSGEEAVLKMHHAQVLQRTISPQHQNDSSLRPPTGTRVEVRDLFGNMPVRVKQRAIAAEKSNDGSKTWHGLKRDIVALLLSWPDPCHISVRDAEDSNRRFAISAHHTSISGALTAKSLDHLAGRPRKFDLRDVLPVLFQADLAPPDTRQRWVPLSAISAFVKLKGVICLDPAPSKQCQFISIGIRPSSTESGHNVLYECVNKAFANSGFGVVEDEARSTRLHHHSPRKGSPGTRGRLNMPILARKGIERFPMFFLQLEFKAEASNLASHFDRLPDASLTALVNVLEVAIEKWLEGHHFGPRTRKGRRNEQQQGPSPNVTPKKRSLDPSHGTDTSPSRHRAEGVVGSSIAQPHLPPELLLSTSPRGVSETNKDSLHRRLLDLSNVSSIRSGKATRVFSHENTGLRIESGLNDATCPSEDRSRRNDRNDQGTSSQQMHAAGESNMREISEPSVLRDKNLSSDEYGSIDEQAMITVSHNGIGEQNARNEAGPPTTDDFLDWMDPMTKRVYKVNARTGVVVLNQGAQRNKDTSAGSSIPHGLGYLGLPQSASLTGSTMRSPSITTSSITRLPEFLKEWNNPVFARETEEPIRVAKHAGSGASENNNHERCFANHTKQHKCNSGLHAPYLGAKVSKNALSQAKVIGQVDQKFILCMISGLQDANLQHRNLGGETMILIDQHAASERVILEGLLEGLCSTQEDVLNAQTPENSIAHIINSVDVRGYTTHSKHLLFEISGRERELLELYHDHFTHWGIGYDLPTPARSSAEDGSRPASLVSEYLLRIKSLPPTIAKRCATFPEVCINMIRTEIWALDDDSRRPAKSHNAQELSTVSNEKAEAPDATSPPQPRWLQRISTCPPGILDMLNSRACRSAIMFNDPLSLEECKALVARLAACVFPFVCAHGRISMVPLADMNEFGDFHEWN